jgi:hypothetical protein
MWFLPLIRDLLPQVLNFFQHLLDRLFECDSRILVVGAAILAWREILR